MPLIGSAAVQRSRIGTVLFQPPLQSVTSAAASRLPPMTNSAGCTASVGLVASNWLGLLSVSAQATGMAATRVPMTKPLTNVSGLLNRRIANPPLVRGLAGEPGPLAGPMCCSACSGVRALSSAGTRFVHAVSESAWCPAGAVVQWRRRPTSAGARARG
jgi:hypothetical protein